MLIDRILIHSGYEQLHTFRKFRLPILGSDTLVCCIGHTAFIVKELHSRQHSAFINTFKDRKEIFYTVRKDIPATICNNRIVTIIITGHFNVK